MTPMNWRDWYNNTINQSRLNRVYDDKYANESYIYKITLDSATINNIRNNEIIYSNWDNIAMNGSSNFIKNPLFDKITVGGNNGGYCGIGVFNSNCDVSSK